MITNQDKNACIFNDAVTCFTNDRYGKALPRCCETCGWNPKVAKERLDKICGTSAGRKTTVK